MIDFFRLYEEKTKNFHIFPRSSTPKGTKILLYGAPKCGKTSLALDLVRHYRRVAFIDCADLRIAQDSLQSSLLKLFLEKQFDALIIDNYLPHIALPQHAHIILITQNPVLESHRESNETLADFTTHCVRPLCFEEYVSLSKSNKLESIFSSFVKEGNLPELLFIPEFKRTQRAQEILQLFATSHTSTFAFLLRYQGKIFNTHNAFCLLKQQQKISKDTIYALIRRLHQEQIIFSIPHAIDSARKKLYFYNFALPYAISPNPHFQAIFENMIVCELLHKLRNTPQANASKNHAPPITYDDVCECIIGELGICAMPFPTQELVESKLAKWQHAKTYNQNINAQECAHNDKSYIKNPRFKRENSVSIGAYTEMLFISIDTTLPSGVTPLPYRVIGFVDFALEYIHNIESM